MDDKAEILQQWVEVITVGGIDRQGAVEGIGREQYKKHKADRKRTHHRQHSGTHIECQSSAKRPNGKSPTRHNQCPQ